MSTDSGSIQPVVDPTHQKHSTLRDVAKLAGVSTKTVSRVVNHQKEISETTRARVQAAIDRLHYRPNILARSLIRQRSRTLAVIAWGIDYFGPSRTLVGVEKEANVLDYSLLLNLVSQPTDNPERILDELISRRVEGIICAIPQVGKNRDWIQNGYLDHIPPLVFLTMESRPGISVVSIDNRYGAKKAVEHLLLQGRRKIGIISGPLTWWEAHERYIGWKQAMQEAGLETPSSGEYLSDDWSSLNGERGMQTLLENCPDIDAVFASSDQIALGAIGIAHKLNRRIPEDLAIVGFDNIPESAFFWPPLTTIYQRLEDVGRIAVRNLNEMINARRTDRKYPVPQSTILRPDLIIRASSST